VAPISEDSIITPGTLGGSKTDELSKLFESPDTKPAAPSKATLPSDTPEVQISPSK
jgi:hypothetical protein